VGSANQAAASRDRSSHTQDAAASRCRKEWGEWLIAKVTAQPNIYLRELQALLREERDVDVWLATICNACRAWELTRKKTLVASEQERPDVAEQGKQRRAIGSEYASGDTFGVAVHTQACPRDDKPSVFVRSFPSKYSMASLTRSLPGYVWCSSQ